MDYGVYEWKIIAASLHAGALDHSKTFKSTEEAVGYLYHYRTQDQQQATLSLISSRIHHDFYYRLDDLPGPMGLSNFFWNGEADCCVLCKDVTVALIAGRYKFKTRSAGNIASNNGTQTQISDAVLNLLRLEHLAVMHTPYFVMLFLELVQNKHYVFYKSERTRLLMADHVFEQLKEKNNDDTTFNGYYSFDLLKVWWKLQNRQSSRQLSLPIPPYLELHIDQDNLWNPRLNNFAERKSEPLYTFLAKHCLCHELWQSGVASEGNDDDDDVTILSPRVTILSEIRQVSTYSLSFLVPKLHVEDILHCLARVCEARQACNAGQVTAASVRCSQLEPRLDCFVLEDVEQTNVIKMHVMTTLDVEWETLNSWVASVRGKALDEQLAFNIHKVLLGVMGSLRDTCMQDKRPPRCLYAKTAYREPKLATAFLVHSRTGDVLSLLPFISIPRLYRSSSSTKDENTFRLACANLALYILQAHMGSDDIFFEKRKELLNWWKVKGTASNAKCPGFEEPYVVGSFKVANGLWQNRASVIYSACELCWTGFVNDNLWSMLGPEEAGLRAACNVDVPHMWLGRNSRSSREALQDKLLSLGFKIPLRVCVIELLREDEASTIRVTRQGFTTPKPKIYQGFLSAVTAKKRRLATLTTSTATTAAAAAIPATECGSSARSSLGYVQTYKRANNDSLHPEAPEKICQTDRDNELRRQSRDNLARAPDSTKTATVLCPREQQQQGINLFACDTEPTENPDLHLEEELFGIRKNNCHAWLNFLQENEVQKLNLPRQVCQQESQAGSLCDPEPPSSTENHCYNHQGDFPAVAPTIQHEMQVTDNQPQILWHELHNQSALQYVPFDLSQMQPPVVAQPLPIVIQGTNNHSRFDYVSLDPSQMQAPVVLWGEPLNQSDLHCTTVNLSQMQGSAVMGEPVEPHEDRQAMCNEQVFLRSNKRWKSVGFTNNALQEMRYTPYQKMTYVTCDSITHSRVKDIVIALKPQSDEPVVAPSGLTVPMERNGWVKPYDLDLVQDVIRKDPQSHKTSWKIGVESRSQHHSELQYPQSLVFKKQIPRRTLHCRREPQTYQTVNLATPPDNGFKYVDLITGEFPTLTRNDANKLLMVRSSNTLYLGPVCTINDVEGLLARKVFVSKVELLQDMLDMHTSLQVHPFVPRTFTLQLVKTPFLNTSAVGVFVGEAAGDWNLGCVNGTLVMTETEKFILAYHVLQCLLRAQILSLRVLGFTLKCIQPARIWRWRAGFRVDFIGCLADTIYVWKCKDPTWGGKEGLAVIHVTMQQLGLLAYLPAEVRTALAGTHKDVFCTKQRHPSSLSSNPDDEHLLYSVYNTCAFSEQKILVTSSWETILGPGQYEDLQLRTLGSILRPYGPFYVQIHNQCLKWNRVIIVEPVLHRFPGLAQVLHVFKGKRHAAGSSKQARTTPVQDLCGAPNSTP